MCEWRFVTRSVVHMGSKCLYVGALLGVWGIIPFLWCLIIWLVCMVCVCWLMVGVLCENCIVDASIKHALNGLLICGLFVCVCVISFFFNQFFCQVHLCGHPHDFCCVWWFVCSLLRAHGGCLGMLSR